MSLPPRSIGVDDVAELRSLLRRDDPAARSIAMGLIRSWRAEMLDVLGARAVLEASGGRYPVLDGDPQHPSELLVRLLWARPRTADVADVARILVLADDPARRALLHLLALRCDDACLDLLERLAVEPSGSPMVPAPTTPVLSPLLAHHDPERVRRLACALVGRPGWSWHAVELLSGLERRSPATTEERATVAAALAERVVHVAGEADRAQLDALGRAEQVRSARELVAALVELWCDTVAGAEVAALATGATERVVATLVGSADPVVSAHGAAASLNLGRPVPAERLELICRSPLARVVLHDATLDPAPGVVLPDALADPIAMAEAELVAWVSDVIELGREPDEVEHVATVELGGHADGSARPLHLFRFRLRAPHWSAARGWMVGAAGTHTFSAYLAEDERDVDGHVEAILTAMADWPSSDADEL